MNKKSIVIFSIVILLVVVGIATFFVLQKNNNNKDEKQSNNTNTTSVANLENKETKNNETNNNETSSKKSAVVYFSATGNTKQIAEYIKDETNSDIFEIIPKQKYTSEDLNYGDNNTRATREQNDDSARPEIENKIDVSNYDVIFLGYPIWWGNVPKIILSFIDSTNLDGKTVAPFCTSGSSGISTSQQTLKSYKSSINWILGERFSSSSSKEEVKTWIDGLHLNLN